jgi:hypothetical protein
VVTIGHECPEVFLGGSGVAQRRGTDSVDTLEVSKDSWVDTRPLQLFQDGWDIGACCDVLPADVANHRRGVETKTYKTSRQKF